MKLEYDSLLIQKERLELQANFCATFYVYPNDNPKVDLKSGIVSYHLYNDESKEKNLLVHEPTNYDEFQKKILENFVDLCNSKK